MKASQILLLLLWSVSMAILAGSCTDDVSCPAIDCNSGVVNEESCDCDCPEGFTGTNCETEDLCITQNIVCENGGSCIDGTCDCPTGYSGANCESPDPAQVQFLLDAGQTPSALYNAGIPIDSLYGKTYQGGLIFYLNVSDGTGLVAAMSDQGTAVEWGCFGTDIELLNNITTCAEDCLQPEPDETLPGTRIGDGSGNTEAILAECDNNGIAAKICRDLGADWFLPSRGELNLMYTNLHAKGYGDFAAESYWNSTECDFLISWFNTFSTGELEYGNKGDEIHVRAARAF